MKDLLGYESLRAYTREITRIVHSDGSKNQKMVCIKEARLKYITLSTESRLDLLKLINTVDGWVAGSFKPKDISSFDNVAVAVFRKLFYTTHVAKPLYYISDKPNVTNVKELKVGSTVVRCRQSGFMNWSYGKAFYDRGYLLQAVSNISDRNILLANIDKRNVAKLHKLTDGWTYNDLKVDTIDSLVDAIVDLARHLDEYDYEREVITFNLPRIKCKVVKYNEV